jgi:hypothetical protein
MAVERDKNGKLKKPIHDPDVAQLVRAVRSITIDDLYYNSYLSRSTIKRLREGKTSRPQHLTMVGIAQAAGYKYELVKK